MQPLNVSSGIYAFLPMGWIFMAFIILGEAFPERFPISSVVPSGL